MRKQAAIWRNDAFEKAAEIARRYGAEGAARDIAALAPDTAARMEAEREDG